MMWSGGCLHQPEAQPDVARTTSPAVNPESQSPTLAAEEPTVATPNVAESACGNAASPRAECDPAPRGWSAGPFLVQPAAGRASALQPNGELAPVPTAVGGWRAVRTIEVGVGYLYKAEFSDDESSVLTLSQQDGILREHAVATGKLLRQTALPNYGEFENSDFARFQGRILVARASGLVQWDPAASSWVAFDDGLGGDGLVELPGAQLAVLERRTQPQSGSVSVLAEGARGPEVVLTIQAAERPDGVALSRDGRFLVIATYPCECAYVLDLAEARLVRSVPMPKWGSNVALDPSGRWLVLGGAELRVLDFASGQVVATDANYSNNIGNVRFSPSGDVLLTAAFEGKARSYPFQAAAAQSPLGKPQVLRHRGTANVYGLGLSRDGTRLATSSGDKSIKIWQR